jgi:hypothetical protein
VYERLWENVWQHSDGGFVTLAEAEACRDPDLVPQTRGQPHLHYFAAIDYAEKHDYTVAVIVHRESSPPTPRADSALGADAPQFRIVVDRMDVVVPRPGEPVQVAWVEDWIRTVASRFPRITFVIDEYQLVGTIQKLEQTHDVRRFPFRAGRGNHRLAVTLRKLILHREVAWYPGCGRIERGSKSRRGRKVEESAGGGFELFDSAAGGPFDAGSPRDDLETELASLLLRQSPGGLCRIDHIADGTHHDDRAFALGAACLYALDAPEDGDWLHVTLPGPEGGFW